MLKNQSKAYGLYIYMYMCTWVGQLLSNTACCITDKLRSTQYYFMHSIDNT